MFYLEDLKNDTNRNIVQVVQNKHVWNVLEVEDIENDQLNVLKIIVEHRGNEYVIEDDTLCRTEVDPTVVERPNVIHIADNFIDDDNDEQSSSQHPSGSSGNK